MLVAYHRTGNMLDVIKFRHSSSHGAPRLGDQARDRHQQGAPVGVPRRGKDLSDRSQLDDAPEIDAR